MHILLSFIPASFYYNTIQTHDIYDSDDIYDIYDIYDSEI